MLNITKYFKIILSYFTDIKPDNIFYHDFILFFYKNFINSKYFLNYLKIKSIGKNIINKIINIVLGDEKIIDYNEERYQLSQLIITKLLFQILENVDLDDDIIIENNKVENSYLYLSKILFDKLNTINDNNIIKKYFIKIILICFNKLIHLKECNTVKEFIQSNLNSLSNLILLISDDIPWLSECEFITRKDFDTNLSEVALFNSKGYKTEYHGEIVCFLNSSSSELFSNYIITYREIFFDKNKFKFFTKNFEDKCGSAFVLIKEHKDYEYFNVSNLEIIKIPNIIMKKNKDDYLQQIFIENYKDMIINTFFVKLKHEGLNEKGIYFLFSLISKLIDKFSESEKIKIFEFLWKYYLENKKEEDESQFISFELLEKIIDKRINYYCQANKFIEKENNNKENLIKEFIYIIRNDDLYLILNNIIKCLYLEDVFVIQFWKKIKMKIFAIFIIWIII